MEATRNKWRKSGSSLHIVEIRRIRVKRYRRPRRIFEARFWSKDWSVQRFSYHDLATHLALLSGGHLFRERNILCQ